jgi:hypothetical protein
VKNIENLQDKARAMRTKEREVQRMEKQETIRQSQVRMGFTWDCEGLKGVLNLGRKARRESLKQT